MNAPMYTLSLPNESLPQLNCNNPKWVMDRFTLWFCTWLSTLLPTWVHDASLTPALADEFAGMFATAQPDTLPPTTVCQLRECVTQTLGLLQFTARQQQLERLTVRATRQPNALQFTWVRDEATVL